jgi:muramoyltetrapeptide carboxypeptidase LdcA involved in peptidoglycan recycling
LFIEDIQEFYTPDKLGNFFDWLGKINALQKLSGIILGKANENISFIEQKERILKIVSGKYGQSYLPILYGLNFGHSSPMCIVPYGALAEININDASFSILESGVR